MMIKEFAISGLLLSVIGTNLSAQGLAAPDTAVYFPSTTQSARAKLYQELVAWDIEANLDYDLNPDNEENWENAFWPMELIRYHSAFAEEKLREAFATAGKRSAYFLRGLLELVYSNFPTRFAVQVRILMGRNREPEIFALGAEYLLQAKAVSAPSLMRVLQNAFPRDSILTDPVLRMLYERLKPGAGYTPHPDLLAWLSRDFVPGCTVLYSFQRKDRQYPGIALVRKPDGSFLRDSAGNLFSVPQLALSITGLPFYLTNGNTPQGLFRMDGFGKSSSQFIGPTEDIQLSLPFEIPPDSFFATHDPSDTVWTLNRYKGLLPPSEANYSPAFQAFYAGQAGRTAIIAHGTTIDPSYYRGAAYYPETPSLGCLCAQESWSVADGKRLSSDQQKLVAAIREAGDGFGYAVVLEVGDQKKPVTMEEIAPWIEKAEQQAAPGTQNGANPPSR